jgi:hypothetical protein
LYGLIDLFKEHKKKVKSVKEKMYCIRTFTSVPGGGFHVILTWRSPPDSTALFEVFQK